MKDTSRKTIQKQKIININDKWLTSISKKHFVMYVIQLTLYYITFCDVCDITNPILYCNKNKGKAHWSEKIVIAQNLSFKMI